jgi:hypothetical protein
MALQIDTSTAPTLFPKQEGGKIARGAKAGDYQQINNGAVKVIYKKIINDGHGKLKLDPDHVVYLSETILGRHELRGEKQTATTIREKVQPKIGRTTESYIQTDMEFITIPGVQVAIEAPAAVGDLDGYIKRTLPLETRLNLGMQVIKGMHNMQKAGYVTGDAKLENILVFERENGKPIARISDFGKARTLTEGSISLVDGNPRFTSPEGVLTRQGEVFSTGLMLLRTLEEGIDPKRCEKCQVGKRRGVEGLLLKEGRKNKKGISGQLAYVGKYSIAKSSGHLFLGHAKSEESAIHAHIDALSSSLFFGPYQENSKDAALMEILNLIKDMTRADPEKRPTMAEAERRYQAALQKASSEQEDSPVPDKIVFQDDDTDTSTSEVFSPVLRDDYFEDPASPLSSRSSICDSIFEELVAPPRTSISTSSETSSEQSLSSDSSFSSFLDL